MKSNEDLETACKVRWLGRIGYQEAWDLQRTLAEERLAGQIPDTLLLLEHPPTITLGRAADQTHILATEETLAREGITVIQSDRGGDVTYHGPGQLVGYPIFHLQEPPHTPDLHRYLRNLEETLIRVLTHYQLSGDRFPGYTGVWVGRDTTTPRKIAAIGIKAGRWVTQHGFALNVAPDLTHFDLIVPCGIHDYGVTSLQRQLGRPVSLTEVFPLVRSAFQDVFGYTRVK